MLSNELSCESFINVLLNGKCRSIVKMAIVVATVDFRSRGTGEKTVNDLVKSKHCR